MNANSRTDLFYRQGLAQAVLAAKQSLRQSTQAVLFSMLAVVWLLLASPSWAAVSTTTELSSSANPAVANQMVTLTMKVKPSTASGSVTLYADGSALSTLSLNASGEASLTTSTASVGTFQLQAIYSGDTGHQTSSSNLLSQTVWQGTSTTLSSSKNPAAVGEPVSITVGVAPPTASGTVELLLNGAVLTSGTLVNGSATISDTAGVAGSYPLQARYLGDGVHAPSVSSVLNQLFSAGGTQSSAKLTLSPSSIAVGQSSTLVVAVSPSTATGSVTFKDGGIALQTINLGSGAVASWTQTFSTAGTRAITAEYAGDALNSASVGTASLNVSATGQPGSVPPSGALTSSFGYNANGQLTTVNLPQGSGQPFARSQTQSWDTLGRERLTQLPPPALAASQPEVVKTWDGRDQLIGVQDPRKLNTTYTIDGLGQQLNQTSPDTGTGSANSTFYADGRLKTRRDARGKLFSYTWDALGRPSQISYSSGTATTFQYDNCTTNAGSVGQLCKLTDESGNTTYSHDGFGRVLNKAQIVTYTPTGGSPTSRSFVLGQTWGSSGGATGKLQSQTYPSKTQVNYLWATNGQLSGISINPVNAAGTATDTTKTVTLLNTLAYTGLGTVKGWAWGDGVAYARSFDGAGRLQTYPLGNPAGSGSAAGLTRTVGYDDAGRINSFTHSGTGANPSGFDQTFGYDGLDRLTANQQATSYGYGYDASGNRNSLKVAANTYAQTIAPTSNRVTTETNATGSKSLQYDTAGNLQSDGTYAYTYSDRGRLSRVTVGTATGAEVANYRYNGLEQRVVKYGPTTKVDGGARFYAYDEAGHLIGEYDKDGNPAYEVVYLGDTPVAVLTQTRTGSPSRSAPKCTTSTQTTSTPHG
ncbi:Ig-like domain repeat protein [Ideonella paludis]|uniref:Ig-like domain repeat protein n=1 Tax=Ideonella paludis TaxID=1233411 RepID=UPI0036309BAB